jgi:hypothetical protein
LIISLDSWFIFSFIYEISQSDIIFIKRKLKRKHVDIMLKIIMWCLKTEKIKSISFIFSCIKFNNSIKNILSVNSKVSLIIIWKGWILKR